MPPGQRGQTDPRLGEREDRTLGRDDQVAGERDLEPTAHGDAVDRGDHGLRVVEARRQAREARLRSAHLARVLGGVLEIVARAERTSAGPRDDRDPQIGIGDEGVEGLLELEVRRRMEGVHHVGAIHRDDVERSFSFDRAKIGHGVLLSRPSA